MASPAPGQRKIDFPDHANISRNMFANERLDIARMPSTPAECPSGLRSATQEQLTILRLFGSEKPFLHMNVCDHSRVLCTRGFEPHFSQFFSEIWNTPMPVTPQYASMGLFFASRGGNIRQKKKILNRDAISLVCSLVDIVDSLVDSWLKLGRAWFFPHGA